MKPIKVKVVPKQKKKAVLAPIESESEIEVEFQPNPDIVEVMRFEMSIYSEFMKKVSVVTKGREIKRRDVQIVLIGKHLKDKLSLANTLLRGKMSEELPSFSDDEVLRTQINDGTLLGMRDNFLQVVTTPKLTINLSSDVVHM